MEIVLEPELYTPNVDSIGNYVDKVPANFKCGIRCACGARKDKVYESGSSFSGHIKTKIHQKWLEDLNFNRQNFFAENEKLKELVKNQRIIIGKLEADVSTKIDTIDFLTRQLKQTTDIYTKNPFDLLD